jgi:hypothetical protein
MVEAGTEGEALQFSGLFYGLPGMGRCRNFSTAAWQHHGGAQNCTASSKKLPWVHTFDGDGFNILFLRSNACNHKETNLEIFRRRQKKDVFSKRERLTFGFFDVINARCPLGFAVFSGRFTGGLPLACAGIFSAGDLRAGFNQQFSGHPLGRL